MAAPPSTTDRLPDRLQATFWPGAPHPARGRLALWGRTDLEAAAREWDLPVGEPATLPTVLPRTPRARTRVARAEVPALVVPILPAVRGLAALPSPRDCPPWRRPSDSVVAWSVAARLACEVVAAGRLVPVLRAGAGMGVAHWRAVPPADGRVEELAAAFPPAAHALWADEGEAVWDPEDLLAAFLDAVADASARAGGAMPGSARAGEPLGTAWVRGLVGPDPVVRLPGGSEPGVEALGAWASPLLAGGGTAPVRLCLRLGLPTEGDGQEEVWPLEYLLQAVDDPSLLIPADRVWEVAGTALELAGRRLAGVQEELIRALAEAARLFPALQSSLAEPRPTRLGLSPEQAAAFLERGAADLAAAGMGVLLPGELTAQGRRRLRARLRVHRRPAAPGRVRGAGLGGEDLAGFRWEAAIGGEAITPEEFREITALKRPLVRWRGRWVYVEGAGELEGLVGTGGELEMAEALAGALAGERELEGIGSVEVVAEGQMAELVKRLRAGGGPGEPRTDGIKATLRPYQERGVAWLQVMADLGFGGILADDMGLGKTLQAICLLADREADRPHLVVCPTSVVGNWERELARFAPGLPVIRHHGPDRPSRPEDFQPGTVAVTSYGLLRRDAELLAATEWGVVVFDEAQQVKNHTTRTARAARRMPARLRLAMTGTPVENRLAELWAILDLTTPGLLGRFGSFKQRYAVPIERWGDPGATEQLHRLVAPFVLRRVKTDPAVAADLPEKQEFQVACSLSREQATLYQAAVDEAFDDLGEGIERRGRILALLTALKQICNHPAHYLGEPGPLPGRSGKLARATEVLAEVLEAGEHALVFTQYRRMGELLAAHLRSALDLPEIPFLHGGVPRAARDAMVERFQEDQDAPPVLLVSLRAGGTGLNLTRATHVLHYDRWWNPAVEDQATDRAYRIGQRRGVTVVKLVTGGTLEERISELIEEKRALAEAVVGSGETWLTELSDEELRALVALSPGEVADEEDR